MEHEAWIRRCLQLARNGAGLTAPNPMVGALLVQGDRILAEGWHRAHGGPHAEVECLNAFGQRPVPTDAVMYVSLEPCSHTGLTPPCADLLIARDMRTVVVGCEDPNPHVAGRGIGRLRDAGIRVVADVLREECRWVNRRFITAMERQRPYVMLKWARSADGFLDRHPREQRGVQRISSFPADVLVHRWRSEEQAILVGSRTVVNDDPELTVRHVAGRQPLRVVLDRRGITPADARVYNGNSPTLLFTGAPRPDVQVDQVRLPEGQEPLSSLLDELHRRNIRSLLVEGGGELLGHFLRQGLWDEARVIEGQPVFLQGTPAPSVHGLPARAFNVGGDRIRLYARGQHPAPEWPW
ncbi:MAG: bifunctional diaminohydroxyphosphoribosylaminopyrimidine deaminase/5-amino-6-(5-phosphoribosylamino)uracil reductase RibD [Flavobacteriales bacterium]|nr:bifunctional diaminohydroxyphosphoribosylaminopyrimidine deaminase/5-amino-6-(5-phosphoribosylamino)uracil reductase RibD [Flavobacteriales bacterium]